MSVFRKLSIKLNKGNKQENMHETQEEEERDDENTDSNRNAMAGGGGSYRSNL